MRGAFETQYVWERGGRRWSSIVPFKVAMVVSYKLSIVTIALSMTIRPKFANQQEWVSLGQSLERKGLKYDLVIGLSYAKKSFHIFCRLNTMHMNETYRQTEHGTNGNIDRNSRNRLLLMSLKMISQHINRS